jgi:carotenoid cleavage dioxygenase
MAGSGESKDIPFHLRGNYAPVMEEIESRDLEIQGFIPPELSGRYFRNGANPRSGKSAHWFFGDGMLHGVEVRDGKIGWYRNRWTRTRTLETGESTISPTGDVDLTTGVANTHVVGHAGKILALVESSFPTEVTRDLETIGPWDFDGKLTTAMTAHPKICPTTGEMHFFGYGFAPPFLTYHVVDAKGQLVQSEVIEVPGATMMHDFAITETRAIFMDLPICFDLERAMSGSMPYRWSDDYGARVGLMPRGGTSNQVQWFEVEPCYVFHPLNAYDCEDGKVVVEVARYDSLWRDSAAGFEPANLYRWTFDTNSGEVSEECLDDRAIEFPRVDERLVGRKHRFGYAAQNPGNMADASRTQLLQYDLETGSTVVHDFGAGFAPGEAVFAPASADAGETEGWVMTYVYDAKRDSSAFVLLDTQKFAADPVAVVPLPQRVPFGFHGSWIPDPC